MMNHQPQYVEVSVDLAAGEIGVNRGDNQRLGPLLDHPGVTLDLERMWRLLRTVRSAQALHVAERSLTVAVRGWASFC